MKAGNKNQGTELAVKQSDRSPNTAAIINLLPVIAMLIAILPGVLKESSGVEIIKIGVLTLILTTAATFFIRINAGNILNKKLAKTIITVSYLFSIALLLFIKHPEYVCFWMIGGLAVAMLIDSKLGLLLHFNLCFILGISLSLQPETIINLLVMGVLMSLLSSALRQKSTFIYAALILLSTNITMAFVINNFIFDTSVSYNYLSSLFSILAVLVTAFLLSAIYEKHFDNILFKETEDTGDKDNTSDKATEDTSVKDNSSDKVTEDTGDRDNASDKVTDSKKETPVTDIKVYEVTKAEVSVSEAAASDLPDLKVSAMEISVPEAIAEDAAVPLYSHFGSRTSYELLNERENSLLMKLKDTSKSLYEHALKIGDLSSRAAKEIGADEMLAKAGGLYHEIGKIYGKNYIEEGIKIADEYSFPKELTLILKQHNIKYDKPTSVEAAIVMLSDNVVSTIEYIEKTEEAKFTPGKIIDNIFQMRMDKGTFDNAGLSLKDFKVLKEFYQKEFNSNIN